MKRANKCVNKKAYATKSQVLKTAKRRYVKDGVLGLSFYECPTCLDFHLTSGHRISNIKQYQDWFKEDVHRKWVEFERLLAEFSPSKGCLKRRRLRANRARRRTEREVESLEERQLSFDNRP